MRTATASINPNQRTVRTARSLNVVSTTAGASNVTPITRNPASRPTFVTTRKPTNGDLFFIVALLVVLYLFERRKG